jgi:RNA recognition motif-containing protein
MGSQEDGIKAIEMFNGYNWQTRVLEVRPDRLPPEYEPHGFASGSNGIGYGGRSGGMTGVGMGMSGMGVNTNGPSPYNSFGHQIPPPPPPQSHQWNTHAFTGGMNPSPILRHMNVSRPILPPHTSSAGSGGTIEPSSSSRRESDQILPPMDQRTSGNNLTARIGSPFNIPGSSEGRRTSLFSAGVTEDPLNRSDSRGTLGGNASSPRRGERLPNHPSSSLGGPAFMHPFSPSDDTPIAMMQDTTGPSKQSSRQGSGAESLYAFDSRRGSLVAHGQAVRERERASGESAGTGGSQRPTHTRQDTVGGRLLNVGNLPFNVSWQELKDLFRTAGGNVVRADIALGPDGRSKGFGNVLFQSEEDAALAVKVFDGYDLNGRSLNVRQDRNSSSNVPQSSHSMSSASLAKNVPGHGSQDFNDRSLRQGFQPGRNVNESTYTSMSRPITSDSMGMHQPSGGDDPKGSPFGSLRRNPPGGNDNGNGNGRMRNGTHPGRIIMPSFSGFAPNPLSPIQTRGMPPMTPSVSISVVPRRLSPAYASAAYYQMPGYNFHAYPVSLKSRFESLLAPC